MSPGSSLGKHVCGCYYALPGGEPFKRYYLPQVKLDSHTTITPLCFTTQLTQTFHNPNTEALKQVRYTFPLYDGVAVNGYTIRYADTVLKGIVKQKDEAKKTYQAAVDRGETAGLLESLPTGVFGVTLGNVPAGTDVVVQITYCGELKHDAAIDGLRWMLPTSIAPRYGSYAGEVVSSNAKAEGGISITVDVDMASSAIRKVQSPSHPIAVSMGATSTTAGADAAPFKPHQASATLTLGTTELAGDFILQLLIDDLSTPRAIIEIHPTIPNQRAIMATLVPKFTLPPMHPEIVFIADQSGSMSGSKNEALQKALRVFLKSLPLGVRFNLIAFGNNFTALWPCSQAYNEENLATAIAFVESFSASYGGTEILKPITAAFEQRLADLPLEVMLLTDGKVWAEKEVFSFINEQIREKKVDARVFGLGIGGDVSHTLVEGVASAGNGFAQFVTQEEQDGTDRKVMRMLKGALFAHTGEYEMEVHYGNAEGSAAAVEGMGMDGDEEFEIIEKVADGLKLDDTPPSADNVAGGGQLTGGLQKPAAKSFFDPSSVDMDVDKQPANDEVVGVNRRYAHLPAIETPRILQAPAEIPPLFPFNRTTVYLLLGPETAQKSVMSVTLRAKSAEGALELSIPVETTENASDDVATVHQLAARKAVQDLEEGRGWLQAATITDGAEVTQAKKKYESRFDELVEREAVRLGEKFQVAGKWTSFVAVQDSPAAPEAQEGGETQEGGQHPAAPAESTAKKQCRRSGGSRLFGAIKRSPPSGGSLLGGGSPGPTVSYGHSASVAGSGRVSMRRAAAPTHFGGFGSSSGGGLFGASTGGYQQARAFQSPPAPLLSASASAPPPPPSASAPRTRTGGKAPRKQLGSKACRRAAPSPASAPPGSHEAEEPEHVAAMHTLISLQTFSGAWAWSEELLAAIELTAAWAGALDLGKTMGRDEKATALAVAFLESRVAGKRDVWEMVVAKARGWLGKQIGLGEEGVEEVIGKAKGVLP